LTGEIFFCIYSLLSMIQLLLKTAAISASGALAPGPLTAASAQAGIKRGWKAGLKISLGHTIVELPLVLLISMGVTAVLKNTRVSFIIGLIGGAFLLYFGITTIIEALNYRQEKNSIQTASVPFLTGVLLTGLNPFFLAWWVGIGTPLIMEAIAEAGYAGVGLFYIAHVWLDYVWLSFIAAVSSFGRLKTWVFRLILGTLGCAVIWFGISMLLKTLRMVSLL